VALPCRLVAGTCWAVPLVRAVPCNQLIQLHLNHVGIKGEWWLLNDRSWDSTLLKVRPLQS